MLVGGTGLYVRAVIDPLTFPPEDRGVRAELEADVATADGLRAAYAELEAADPVAASRMEPGNARRIVRALEVIRITGRPFSSFGLGLGEFGAAGRRRAPGRCVAPARRAGAPDRCTRSARMAEAGLVDEVRSLAAAGSLSRTARQAIGYKEVLDHLEGREPSLAAALETAEARTRQFARRQRMWFRRDPRITWLATPRQSVHASPHTPGNLGRMSIVRLSKLHATGNDFLVVVADATPGAHGIGASQARALRSAPRRRCRRPHRRSRPGPTAPTAAMMLFNADGHIAEMSGNGIRCLAWVAQREGIGDGKRLVVDTDGGRRTIDLELDDAGEVVAATVDMGPRRSTRP